MTELTYAGDEDFSGLDLETAKEGLPSWGERYGAARRMETLRTDAWGAWAQNYRAVLQEAGEEAYGDPDAFQKYFDQNGGSLEVAADGFLKGIQSDDSISIMLKGNIPATYQASRDVATARARKEYTEDARIAGAGGGWTAETLAGFERAMTDEVGVTTAAIGLFTGGTSLTLRGVGIAAAREGALGAAGEIATIPSQQRAAAELGVEGPDIAAQVGLSGAISAAFPVAGYGIGSGYRAVTRSSVDNAARIAADRSAAASSEEALSSPLTMKEGLDAGISAARAVETDGVYRLPQTQMTPEQQTAAATPAAETQGIIPEPDAPAGEDAYYARLRQVESGGNDSARARGSSATGRYQFIDSTWAEVSRRHPELGLTPDGRFDPVQQERAIRAFTEDNREILRASGVEPTDGDLYLAHFSGVGGARQVLSADPNTPIRDILGIGVINANAGIRHNGKRFAEFTAADLRAWAAAKMGGPVPTFRGSVRSNTQSGSNMAIGPVVRGAPDQFGIDDAAYPSGFSVEGRSTREMIEAWNDQLAGNLVFHERLDGSRWVVDGRARHEAATRIAARGGEVPQLQGIVLREADGWTTTQAAMQGAVMNAARSNDPVEMAAAIRAMPELSEVLGTDDAMALTRISDAAFDSLRAGRISTEDAMFMGRDRTPSAERARIANGAARLLDEGGTVSGADLRAAATRSDSVSAALDDAVRAARTDGDDAAVSGLVERIRGGEFGDDIDGAATRLANGGSTSKDQPSDGPPAIPDIDLATDGRARAAVSNSAYGRAVELVRGLNWTKQGPFGPVFDGFKGRWREAVEALRIAKTGEAPGALSHPDIGDIALAWGAEGQGRSTGFGVSKLIRKHPEMLDDLQARLSTAKISSETENRIRLKGDGGEFVVSRDWMGRDTGEWLLTAYDPVEGSGRSMIRPANRSGDASSPALANKDNTNAVSDQAAQDRIAEVREAVSQSDEFADQPFRVEMDDGSTVEVTARQLLDDLDEDTEFLDQLNLCRG